MNRNERKSNLKYEQEFEVAFLLRGDIDCSAKKVGLRINYSALNGLFAANNDAAPYFLALDWILHNDKGWQDDYTVERGYDLMASLKKNGNWLANSYYDEKGRYEKTNEVHREICGCDL